MMTQEKRHQHLCYIIHEFSGHLSEPAFSGLKYWSHGSPEALVSRKFLCYSLKRIFFFNYFLHSVKTFFCTALGMETNQVHILVFVMLHPLQRPCFAAIAALITKVKVAWPFDKYMVSVKYVTSCPGALERGRLTVWLWWWYFALFFIFT